MIPRRRQKKRKEKRRALAERNRRTFSEIEREIVRKIKVIASMIDWYTNVIASSIRIDL